MAGNYNNNQQGNGFGENRPSNNMYETDQSKNADTWDRGRDAILIERSARDKSNNIVIVLLSVLCVLVLCAVALGALYFGGVIGDRNNAKNEPAVKINNKKENKPNQETKAIDDDTNTKPDIKTDDEKKERNYSSGKEEKSVPTTMYVANVENSIYFRSLPKEEEDNIICTIAVGTPIVFLENTNHTFAKISYDGEEGYVKREYLSTSVPKKKSESPQDNSVKYSLRVVNVENSIYLRKAPSESPDNIICTIPLGSIVGYIETTNSVFTKIKYNGITGYSKSEYLEIY